MAFESESCSLSFVSSFGSGGEEDSSEDGNDSRDNCKG